MSTGQVDRCVCHNVTFEEMLRLRASGADLARIQHQTGCGSACGLCVPYIRAALATGCPSLPVMSPQQLEQLAEAPIAKPC